MGSLFAGIKNKVFEYRKDSRSLVSLTIRGSFWMAVSKIVNRGLGFARTIVLARLLSPNDFGLFGIAYLFASFIENFSVTGINAALIQKKENISDYLDSAWTFNLARSCVLFFVLYVGAESVALFFENPNACPVIRAIAFLQIIVGTENIGTIYFQKDIRFEKLAWLKFGEAIVNVTVSITIALILRNAWALVYGALAGAFFKTCMSYAMHPYRPKLQFHFDKLKELLGYGKWIFGSSILVFLITQGDDAFVGKVLGAAALGFYQMAYNLSNIPATEISNFVSQITFPIYSKIQADIPKLKTFYMKAVQIIAYLSFPIAGLIAFLAFDFTKLVFGEKWMPMVPAMQALAVWGLVRSIGSTTTQVFHAVGKPTLSTKVKLSQMVFIFLLIYPLSAKWGILGTSLAVVTATLIPNLVAYYIAVNIVQGRLRDFYKILFLPLINTVIMLFVISVPKMLWESHLVFILQAALGVAVYIVVTNIFNALFAYDMWFVIRKIREEIKI